MRTSNGKRVIITHQFKDGEHVKMRYDDLGLTRGGNRVSAVTDAEGAQVIILGPSTHLVSQVLSSHRKAITLGEQVLKEGVEIYPDWKDLRSKVAQFVRAFLSDVN